MGRRSLDRRLRVQGVRKRNTTDDEGDKPTSMKFPPPLPPSDIEEYESYQRATSRPKRRRLTPRQRATVAYRQEYRCITCRTLLTPWFEVDHIVPLHLDGDDDWRTNMNAKCVECKYILSWCAFSRDLLTTCFFLSFICRSCTEDTSGNIESHRP